MGDVDFSITPGAVIVGKSAMKKQDDILVTLFCMKRDFQVNGEAIMGKNIYTVEFRSNKGTCCCDVSFQQHQQKKWQEYLKHARDNNKSVEVYCQCKKDDDGIFPRLRVSYSQTRDRCWLSSWQFSGNRHIQGCRFYSVWALQAQGKTYTSGVVTQADDGSFRVRLPTGLQKKEVKEEEATNAPDRARAITRPGVRRPAMTVLGLLHFMWEQTGLNTWKPEYEANGKSLKSGTVASRLLRFSDKVKAGKISLSEVLLVMAGKEGNLRQHNLDNVRQAGALNKRLILISTLASWTPAAEERSKNSIALGMFGGFPNLSVPEDVRDRCEKSFERELASWRNKKGKIIVIAETQPPVTHFTQQNGKTIPSTSAEVIDMALMVISPRFIPLDSGYEAVIEEKLWKEERAFVKPLRYDGEEDTLPDFILTDTDGEDAVPLEVYGMNTREYTERKQQKQALYAEKYGDGKWWYWDATAPDAVNNIPPFPPVSNKA